MVVGTPLKYRLRATEGLVMIPNLAWIWQFWISFWGWRGLKIDRNAVQAPVPAARAPDDVQDDGPKGRSGMSRKCYKVVKNLGFHPVHGKKHG